VFWSCSSEGRRLRLPRSGQMASVGAEEPSGCLSGKGKPCVEESVEGHRRWLYAEGEWGNGGGGRVRLGSHVEEEEGTI
jgi:hypothetical protein